MADVVIGGAGDSITQGASDQDRGFGMAAELQAAYVRRFDVINRGYSGYNTDHALDIITRALPTPQQASVKFLTIWFGANDSNTNPTQGQYVPPSSFRQNLLEIINHPLIKSHSPPVNIILITPPPFEESMLVDLMKVWGATGVTRKAADARLYAEIVKDVGMEANVPVVDAWGLCMEKTGWKGDGKEGDGESMPGGDPEKRNEVLKGLLFDGLHLSPSGYRIVFDGLIKVMKENWPEYLPYKMPFTEKVPWEIELGDQMWDVNNDK
ncbi:related to IAH1 Isoamyl acetate hydrolytic enzyme [Rhynchosporium secalis]|uniref:Related to IAH1 Isoamyl acetate hydrolytic enzyme n=1 Tax=Rhynchosporium secalis TaxID=38038 RepID=A0A1E1LZ24_RHYSE|nr:related to IAH1 Isoamyl acetate hydrolytic enzyme [Rhynchosporium secalis]